jgi:uncharacterized SAM-binding protein YcdF (DUF218 family)
MFIVGKILAALAFPPGIFILVSIAFAILIIKKKPKAAAFVAFLNAAVIYALSTSVVASMLASPLEDKYPPLSGRGDARAIVVLGGGYIEGSPEYGGKGTLSPDSEKRAIYGLELSRESGLPLLYSGGKAYGSRQPGSGAEAAGRLWLALGEAEDRITLETESLDTRGNARGIASLAGQGPFLLVTSALHMPRSMLSFERAGIRVIAAPTDFRARRSPLTFSDFLPDASCLEISRFALHEYVGLAYYFLT